jgi:hypothetical protein
MNRKYKLRPGLYNQLSQATLIEYNKITMDMLIEFLDDLQAQRKAGQLIMDN